MTISDLAQLQQLDRLVALSRPPRPPARALHPHEAAAGIRPDRHRPGLDAITAQTFARLLADRRAFAQLVRDYATGVAVRHPQADGVDARALMLALGGAKLPLTALPGVDLLLAAARAFHADALADAARLGAVHVRAEARAQGVRLPVMMAGPNVGGESTPAGYRIVVPATGRGPRPPDPDLALELEQRADYAAEAPLVDLAGRMRDITMGLPSSALGYDAVVDAVLGGVDELSTAGLETDYAGALAQQALGLGRTDEAGNLAGDLGEPVQTYASELDDRNTCGPCFDIDGTVFPTRAEGERAYAGGVYEACAGGGRCRGTLVYVWGSEAAPSV